MIKHILASSAAALAIVAAAPAGAEQQEAAAPTLSAPVIDFTEWSLDNGLRVIAIPDETTATVTTSLWYEVGSKHDPEGRSGFAHLFEHILSRKTENMPYNMIYGLTADVGGTRNASTGGDRTNYYETVPAEYLERMLWTHRERMFKPVIDQEVFDRERDVVKEELRQRVLAPPYGRMRFVVAENAYDHLPYRRTGIGSLEDLDAATLDDARAFHQAFYGPDTATLIVAGNFQIADLHSLVNQYFGDIPRRTNPVDLAITIEEPQRSGPRSLVATAPNVPLPISGSLWRGPGTTHPDAPALDVLAAIMTRGENSRLDERLVRSGKAVDTSFFYSENEDGGYIAGYATLNPQANIEEIDAILAAEIARLRDSEVSPAELAEAKNEIFASALRQRETARGRAFELGEALVSTGDPRAADKRLAGVAAVTPADIRRVANAWLEPETRVDFRYVAGEDDPSSYANPVRLPEYRTLPPVSGEPLQVLPEGVREEPPAPGKRPDVAVPPIVATELDNGIELVATQTGDVPIATMTVLFPGGSASDPRDKAGLAEFAAALAGKGTDGQTATDIASQLEGLGAQLGATVNPDGTFISLTAPVANLAAAGAILADVVTSASYPQGEVDRERKRTIDGLTVEMKDPGAVASKLLYVALYGDAPYGTQTGGTVESLASITREDLVAHRETWWHPGTARIIVSGGISTDAAQSLANDLFGSWTVNRPAPATIVQPAGTEQSARTIVVDIPDAGQAAVFAATRAVSRSDETYYALDLANSVLGGGSSGRLFEEVRTKRSLSYGSYSGVPDRADASFLYASAQTKNESAAEVAKIILGEMGRLGAEPLDDDLLEARRLFLSGNNARALESSNGFNAIVAGLVMQGIAPDEAAAYADRLSGISSEAASEAARRYADPDRATLIVVGDSRHFIDDLKALRSNVELVSIDELDLSRSDLRRQADGG
ncbi:pitrilysin family protein [Altererythrobacter arenosus]|uniref:Pitrilysin family protein n=1 Tax=Altererythrobacter arenosus TaxID=3032592 RepID=A0ABY8FT49_9SPHN|nr:pitrilysin family protein [Altererythrobacter sp. CAU 1644]WFL78191.1 pitrilysin family protein [Altererythrobacter sp. CAU 1644]